MTQKVSKTRKRTKQKKILMCLSCGNPVLDGRKKYCSTDCRDYLAAQLDRWTGLLVGLETRFANFWFTEKALVLDVLRYNSNEVLRFIYQRSPGKKPFEDYFYMADELGTHWWNALKKTRRKLSALENVLSKAHKTDVSPEIFTPKTRRTSKVSQKSLACLKLNIEDLTSSSARQKVKTAFRLQARKHHPDAGGSSKSFIKVRKAYDELNKLLSLQENSGRIFNVNDLIVMTRQKSVPGKWRYDGRERKWYKPASM